MLITWISASHSQVVNSRRESDAGVYWCEARNEFGVSKSRNATLQVAGKRDTRMDTQSLICEGKVYISLSTSCIGIKMRAI